MAGLFGTVGEGGDVEPTERERPWMVQALVFVAVVFLIGCVVVKMVLASAPIKIARAAQLFDDIAARQPNLTTAMPAIQRVGLAPRNAPPGFHPRGAKLSLLVTLPVLPFGYSWRAPLYRSLGFRPLQPTYAELGTMSFRSGGEFAGGENRITGTHYPAAETTGTR